jgi:hypothetical protein
MVISPDPLERHDFDASLLMAEHPPVWRNANKQAVFEVACPPGTAHGGRLGYSRWSAMPLPDRVDPRAVSGLIVPREGYFDYAPLLDPGTGLEWHLNFADPHLFVAYGGSLFAQDEMQVLEHPALGALKEALTALGRPAITAERGRATPVLVTGAERRCRVATEPNPAAGRPDGLYGNAFGRAGADTVRRATTRIDPPTITNLVAIAAPSGGHGRYRADEIESVLVTAYTGFGAAVRESRRGRDAAGPVVVHSGYWGCGAFGGNRVLMTLLQALAAAMAGLDRLVFHTGAPGGRVPLDRAVKLLREEIAIGGTADTRELIERIEAMAFEWGVSDGN